MKTLHEVGTLGGWMNDVLISWGIPSEYANMFDEFVVAALIILLAVGLNYFFSSHCGRRHQTICTPFSLPVEYFAGEA